MKTRTESRFAGTSNSLRRFLIGVRKKERGLNMRKAALMCFLILFPCSLRAQDKKGDWKALYGLRSGEKIELVETGMKKHVGTFSTVTEEAIQLREGSNDIGIRKESVARVTCSKRAIGSATLRSSESSARAQARESGQQHRDVPIRMVRSTYVV